MRQKFLFLITKKESKNKKLPSKWTPFASLKYSLSSSAFIFLTLIIFLSYCDQTSALKTAYIFKVFGAQSCLMIA